MPPQLQQYLRQKEKRGYRDFELKIGSRVQIKFTLIISTLMIIIIITIFQVNFRTIVLCFQTDSVQRIHFLEEVDVWRLKNIQSGQHLQTEETRLTIWCSYPSNRIWTSSVKLHI